MVGKVETVDNVKQITKLTSNIDAVSLDDAFPIGFVYVQYPQQAAPADLFSGFTWTEVNYSGAFFRASGGNADSFITPTGTLTPQGQTTAVNGLGISKTGSCWGNSTTAYSDAQWHVHNHAVYINNIYAGGSNYGVAFGLQGPANYDVLQYGYADYYDNYYVAPGIPVHSHVIDFYPSVSENISFTVSGATETRPKNFTVRIWERTA